MGKRKGFSRLFPLFMVVLMLGGCAGKPGTAHMPQDESDVSRTYVEVSEPSHDSSSDSEPSEQPAVESGQAGSMAASSDMTESEAAPEEESRDEQQSQLQEESVSSVEESSLPVSETSETDEPSDETAKDVPKNSFVLWSPESGYVPESSPVEDSYFSDALFVGDSRMQGFVLYSGLTDVQAYTSVGLTVDTAYSRRFVQQGEEELTLAEALKRNASNFGKIYLLFGMNELGWGTWSVFVSKYGGLIDIIQQANPNAVIYLESLIPLTAKKSAESDWLNNDHVNSFNKMIWQLAADKGVNYLNTAAGLAGDDGVLPEDDSSDGVHLNKDACVRWLEYLKTHTAGAGS